MHVRKLIRAAMIAAIYVVLCIVLAPFSFGPVQVRVAEALTLLVVFAPEAILGVTVGCFIANMIASMPIDMVVGTLTTLVAGIVSYKLRGLRWKGLPVLASLPPVLFNAVIVGIELTVLYTPDAGAAGYVFNMLSVGAGQIVSCCALGLLLVFFIQRSKPLHSLFSDNPQII